MVDPMNFPVLYKRTSTGAIQTWKVEIVPMQDGSATIITTYGQLDGALQITQDRIWAGKNVGKSNETSATEQAMAEAGSKWMGKLKKGYVQTIDSAKAGEVDAVIAGGVSAMLAHKFSEQASKIVYPAYVQPKLDGHRCIAIVQDGVCTLWSRTRKPILGVPHIARALEARYPVSSVVFDGELYNHDYKDKFEELSSFIRQEVPKPGHEVVEYWIYDVVNDKPFGNRILIPNLSPVKMIKPLVVVPTHLVGTEENLFEMFQIYRDLGYEGIMVRNQDSLYKNGRSYDLLKVKEFDDDEFEIVDVLEGRGKMADKAVFLCKTKSGDEFGVKMKGALDDLREYLVNKHKYIGKKLTVQYQGLTGKNGVPRFPVGIRIREEL